MNIFERAIEDIFSVPEFVKFFVYQGKKIPCIPYESETDSIYTQFGLDNGKQLYITVKCKDFTPAKGQKINYNGKIYKVDSFSSDSFEICSKILIKDITSK